MEAPRSGVTSAERRAVFTLFINGSKKTTTEHGGSQKKLEGHRKLVRYEQRPLNKSARPPASKNNKTNPKGWLVGVDALSHDKRFYPLLMEDTAAELD